VVLQLSRPSLHPTIFRPRCSSPTTPEMTAANKPLAIIYGVGRSPGLGYSLAKLFAETHAVAILSRSLAKLEPIAANLRATGGDVRAFEAAAEPVAIAQAFETIRETFGEREVTLGIWNAATRPAPKSFLDISDAELTESTLVNVRAPAAFARSLLPLLLANPLETTGPRPKARGTLLFTGATASNKGSAGFAAFASGKFGLKAIAQSLAREYGKDGVHVGHVVIDGCVLLSLFPSHQVASG
jgi:NAD(P)-dependent dehydrogenase (short-subunit alcohol dehydrogenase family)